MSNEAITFQYQQATTTNDINREFHRYIHTKTHLPLFYADSSHVRNETDERGWRNVFNCRRAEIIKLMQLRLPGADVLAGRF